MNEPLQNTLQQVRKARRISQLELSMRLGISQRHVSFVERGRSKPSRGLLLAWLQALDTPMALCNKAMLDAGFAPAYPSVPLDDPTMARANRALEALLTAHDPMPALVLDADWNLIRANRGGQWLAATLMPGLGTLENVSFNMLDLLAHPDGLTRCITNLEEVGPPFLAHLREQAAANPGLEDRVGKFEHLLATRLGDQPLLRSQHLPAAPVMTTRYETAYGELAFFSMFTTFGTPQDITLASLRVEHMFAADSRTAEVLAREVAIAG